MDLGTTDALPVRIGSLPLEGIAGSSMGVCNKRVRSGKFVVTYTSQSGSPVLQLAAAPGSTLPTVEDSVRLELPYTNGLEPVQDSQRGYTYIPVHGTPGRVLKYRVGATPEEPMQKIGELVLAPGEDSFLGRGNFVDEANGYVYFVLGSSGSFQLVKIATNEGDTAPVRIGATPLTDADGASLAGDIVMSAADSDNGYGYLLTNSPAKLVKVRLGAGNDAPTVASALLSSDFSSGNRTMAIDPAYNVAYVIATTTQTSTPGLYHVSLGTNDTTPVLSYGQYTEPPSLPNGGFFGSNWKGSAVDLVDHVAYFGSVESGSPANMVVVPFRNDGTFGPVLDQYVGQDEMSVRFMLFSQSDRSLYLTSDGYKILRFAAGAVGELPTYLATSPPGFTGALLGETIVENSLICYNGGISRKFSIREEGAARGTLVHVPSTAQVSTVSLYVRNEAGNVRLAIYDDKTSKQLLWESPSVAAASAVNSVLSVTVSSGAPATLTLPVGRYWLAVQTDNPTGGVTSQMTATHGVAFATTLPYGPFPSSISRTSATATPERISIWLDYTIPPAVVQSVEPDTPMILTASDSGRAGTLEFTPATGEAEGESSASVSLLYDAAIPSDSSGFDSGKALPGVVDFTASGVPSGQYRATIKIPYTDAEVTSAGIDEETIAVRTYDTVTGTWVLAVEKNTNAPVRSWKGVSEPTNELGDYGVDTLNNYAWAVIDHNTEFAVGQASVSELPVSLSGFFLE